MMQYVLGCFTKPSASEFPSIYTLPGGLISLGWHYNYSCFQNHRFLIKSSDIYLVSGISEIQPV